MEDTKYLTEHSGGLVEKLYKQIEEAKPFIEEFCRKYNNKFLDITVTTEKGEFELAYIFDDGLGYYTIKGIKTSLV